MESVAQNPERLAYTVDETAALLGISSKSVRRLLSRGLLKGNRALRIILIPRAEIERFLMTGGCSVD